MKRDILEVMSVTSKPYPSSARYVPWRLARRGVAGNPDLDCFFSVASSSKLRR